MKRIVLFLILIMTFAFSAINEYKTDVYFGNGIMTTYDEAFSELFYTLKPAILYDIYHGNKVKMLKMHNF